MPPFSMKMPYDHFHTAILYSQLSRVALRAGLPGSLKNGTDGSRSPESLALYIRIEWLSLSGVCTQFENEKDAAKGASLLYQIDHHISICSSNLLLPILFSSFRIPNCILFERYLNNNGFEPMQRRNRSLLEAMQRKNTELAKKIMKESIEQTIQGNTEIYQDKNK